MRANLGQTCPRLASYRSGLYSALPPIGKVGPQQEAAVPKSCSWITRAGTVMTGRCLTAYFPTILHNCIDCFHRPVLPRIVFCTAQYFLACWRGKHQAGYGLFLHCHLTIFFFCLCFLQLQGSLKRKLVVNLSPVNNKRPNGVSDSSFLDIKRIRVGDNISVGQGGHHVNNCQSQSMSGTMSVGQGSQRKTSNLANNTHASGNGIFNMTLKEVKKEPGETMSCSKHLDGQMSHENMFPNRYGEDSGEQMMDPELQELFNELTNISVPPMSDLELENMINATIKQDEPFNIDLGQQSQRGPVRPLQMDKMVIKSEYAPGMNQAPVGSPQMRPSSTGPAFTMATAAMSTSSPIPSVPQNQTQVAQVSSASSRPVPNWQEVSHAQQLKQIAANRQQHALIQQQQQQQNQTANWSTLSPSGPSPGPFVQEKIPSPSFRQQQFSPQSSAMLGVPVNGNQSKGMNNYVYKPTTPQSNPMDIIMQQKTQDLNRNFINSAQPPLEQHHGNTKPLFHFNSEQTNQQMPSVLGSQSKPALLHYTQQAQSSAPVQQPQPQQQQQPQPPSAQPLPNQSLQRPPNVPLAMQQKMMLQKIQQSQQISGLQYPVSQQHRQVRQIPPYLVAESFRCEW